VDQLLNIRINDKGKKEVFDPVRRKYVALTPEEYVRQQMILYLVKEKGFPLGLLKVETALSLNGMTKRTDIMVYSRTGNPVMIVECKAESVQLTQAAFDQLARYNLKFNVPYLVATNGIRHYCCVLNVEQSTYTFIKEIPCYNDL
jgi:hypothetical protein